MIYLIYKYLLYKLSEQLSELNKNNIRYNIYNSMIIRANIRP